MTSLLEDDRIQWQAIADYLLSREFSAGDAGKIEQLAIASRYALVQLQRNPDWIDDSAFGNYESIEVDREEPHAANALLVGQNVMFPASFPRTMDKLVTRGINMTPIDLSELQKAEGAATCCSLILTAS